MPQINEAGKVYIGIDPGASGGIAAYFPDQGYLAHEKMPSTEGDVWSCLTIYGEAGPLRCYAIIEQVTGYIGNKGDPGSAMFKFGTSYGGLRMALIGVGIPFQAVMPRIWQKGLGISGKGSNENRTAFKNRLKARAQELFPREVITLATADAILIAEYCRRRMEGLL